MENYIYICLMLVKSEMHRFVSSALLWNEAFLHIFLYQEPRGRLRHGRKHYRGEGGGASKGSVNTGEFKKNFFKSYSPVNHSRIICLFSHSDSFINLLHIWVITCTGVLLRSSYTQNAWRLAGLRLCFLWKTVCFYLFYFFFTVSTAFDNARNNSWIGISCSFS